MLNEFGDHLDQELKTLHKEGLYKHERELRSPQGSAIKVAQGDVLNFCANNYLGLADDADLIAAARESLTEDGFGMASVRFICGTNSMHHKLEKRLAEFLGMDEAILYSSCFDANAGLFETLLGARGCGDLGRAQSRVDHRRGPPLQGEALSLCQQRHGRPRGPARGRRRGGRAVQADRDRRRVFHGRRDRRPARHLRPGRPLRRHGHGGQFPCLRLHGRERPRHARVSQRGGAGRHRHHHLRQGARRRLRRGHGGARADRRLAAPALAPLSVLEFAGARHRRGDADGDRQGRAGPRPARAALEQRRAVSASGWRRPGSSWPGPIMRSFR